MATEDRVAFRVIVVALVGGLDGRGLFLESLDPTFPPLAGGDARVRGRALNSLRVVALLP
jgi:hypothetical protein